MEEKFRNKYRMTSFRKPNWDYGAHGLYFVTICTKDRLHYFGDIVEASNVVETQYITQNTKTQEMQNIVETQHLASLRRTEIGDVAYYNWLAIDKHFPFIELDEFVIMPNHVHGILFINKPLKENWELSKFGSQSQNLASVIRGYKASVKTYATKNNIEFDWQSKYHDRIIRNEKEYINIANYINRNPETWALDVNYIFDIL